MKTSKTTGRLLIISVIAVLIPYTLLTIRFDYPAILRRDAGSVLTAFHQGGPALIFTWWAFAMSGLPLLIAYAGTGKLLAQRGSQMKWVTSIGIISVIVQMIGLLRWVFVVPVLAASYITAPDAATKQAAVMIFQTVHQFGGVLLGEHLGQLFTVIWTVMVCYKLYQIALSPKWVSWFGIAASLIYLAAQAELFATVIPGLPVWSLAGFAGSTLWLIWLLVLGILLMKQADRESDKHFVT